MSITRVAVSPTKQAGGEPAKLSVKTDLTLSPPSENAFVISEEGQEEEYAEENGEEEEEEGDTVKVEPGFPQPMQYPGYYPGQYPAFPAGLSGPLAGMSSLAAMYQQQQQQQHSQAVVKQSQKPVAGAGLHRPLDWYRDSSQQGKVALDLLPEDINAIMAQSTTPACPICNKDCGNFPNLRSHLQVKSVPLTSQQPLPNSEYSIFPVRHSRLGRCSPLRHSNIDGKRLRRKHTI